jgi:hypothetical protein
MHEKGRLNQRQDLGHAEIVSRVGLAHKSVGLKEGGQNGRFCRNGKQPVV